jgi:hypothetical protein
MQHRHEQPFMSQHTVVKAIRAIALIAITFQVTACAELSALNLPMPAIPGMPMNQQTVAAGLREALEVGTQRASSSLSRTGGFSDSPLLRLALPKELDAIARSMRAVGMGAQVDALELSMNRAAEAAVAEAVPVFAAAISSMTIADAFAILQGSDTAATDYFKGRTSTALRARFTPIAQDAMRAAGLYRVYRDVSERVERIPFVSMPTPNLEEHVTDHALAGLFAEIAKEETRIRADPAARSSALLRRVFSI